MTAIKYKLYPGIKKIIEQARSLVVQNVNTTLVFTNFYIGKMIVENEQQGNQRAAYARRILKNLSYRLSRDFGKGYSEDNLNRMRTFYLLYFDRISATVLRKFKTPAGGKFKSPGSWQTSFSDFQESFSLSWSHYLFLLKIADDNERNFYEIEARQNNWSVRELQRQLDSSLYQRLSSSKNQSAIRKLSKRGQMIKKPIDLLKEPYTLEFLELPEKPAYKESQLESAIISRLESFLLELGKGFLFQSRQERIGFNGKNFYIDLVFYNRLLKCFVLIDLKIGELMHQDLGQMQMYVNYYDREIKNKDENNTVGIILCKETNQAIVKYTLPLDNKNIFAREYKLYLPSRRALKNLLNK